VALYKCIVIIPATNARVTTGPGKSWKVMGFRKTKLQAWIVMENNIGHGKSWKVMEKPWKGHGKMIFTTALRNSVMNVSSQCELLLPILVCINM